MAKPELPLDRGYAWFVVLGGHLVMMFIIGSYKSFGLFFVEFRDVFVTSAANTSVMFSLIMAGVAIVNPIATAMGGRIGYRPVAIMGGVFCSSGPLIASFASSFSMVLVSFGGLFALGMGCLWTPGMIMVSQYFRKRRSLAHGLMFTGTSIGTLVLPLLIRYAIDYFGLRGALLIFAGCVLHLCIGGALFRPLSFYKAPSDPSTTKKTEEHKDSLLSAGLSMEKEEIVEQKEGTLLQSFVASFSCCSKTKNNIKPFFDFTIFKDFLFITYVLANMTANPAYLNSFAFLPPFANDIGMDKTAVSRMLALSGACDLVARIVFGWFSDLEYIHRYNIIATCLLITGFATFLVPFCPNEATLATMMVVVGIFGGGYVSLFVVVLVDYVGLARMPNALGLAALSMNLSNAVMPLLFGSLADHAGSFGVIFHVCGVLYFLGASCYFSAPLARKLKLRWAAQANDADWGDTSIADQSIQTI